MTAQTVAEYDAVLCVGDTTFLDYDKIVPKREGYGPIGIQVLRRGGVNFMTQLLGFD